MEKFKLFVSKFRIPIIIFASFILLLVSARIIDHIAFGAKVETTEEFWLDSSGVVYLMNKDMDYNKPFSDFTKNKIEEYVSRYKNDMEMTENDEALFRDVLELNVQYNKLLLKEFIGKGSMSEYDRIQELKEKLKDDYNIE